MRKDVPQDPRIEYDLPWASMPPHERALHWAAARVGEKELGENAGPFVSWLLAHVGLGPGYHWCAAFVYTALIECGADPAMLPKKRQAAAVRSWVAWAGENDRLIEFPTNEVPSGWSPRRGDLGWFLSEKGTGHVWFVTQGGIEWFDGIETFYCVTIEGNTGKSGSRNGDGVYRRRRDRLQLSGSHRWGFIRMDGI